MLGVQNYHIFCVLPRAVCWVVLCLIHWLTWLTLWVQKHQHLPSVLHQVRGFTPTPSDAGVQHSGRRAGLLSTRVLCSAEWVLSRSWAPVAVKKHRPPFPFFNSRLMWRNFDCVYCHFFPFAPHLQNSSEKTEKKWLPLKQCFHCCRQFLLQESAFRVHEQLL